MSIIQLLFHSNPSPLPTKSFGGTVYTPGNGYVYHVFLQPGIFSVNEGPIFIESLIVAGGGSGGQSTNNQTGGGGAGGVRIVSTTLVTGSSYPIVIGSGGLSPGTVMSSGSPSSAFNFTATGGGRGTDPATSLQRFNGGSGGGSTTNPDSIRSIGNDPRTSPSQGNPGGLGNSPTASGAGGGGGGSLSTGSDAFLSGGNSGGNGGAGISTSGFAGPLFPQMPADWITAVGPLGNYGGGGGGGSSVQPGSSPQTQSSGGVGGGGKGKRYIPTVLESTSGVDYTGGGGGGGGGSNIRSGGIGIVIVRYLV